MRNPPKPKNESSRMTLTEYVMFSKRKGVDMETAEKVKAVIQKIAGEKYGTKKGSGISADSKTPYVKPEYWEKAFQEIKK